MHQKCPFFNENYIHPTRLDSHLRDASNGVWYQPPMSLYRPEKTGSTFDGILSNFLIAECGSILKFISEEQLLIIYYV